MGRQAFRYWYDLKQKRDEEDSGANVLRTIHIDKGEQTTLYDASFKPIELKDAKGSWVLNAYDKLQRPIQLWGRDITGESISLRQFFEYGTDVSKNLLGKPHKLYDEAGLIVNEEFDFKGNLLKKHRQTLKHSELLSVFDGPPVNWNVQCYRVDWTGLNTSILSTKEFRTITAYDALNRITRLTYPDDADNVANELVPTYNNAGALEKVIFNNETYVEHIAYNAKGQRILLALGNNIMTRYTYDTQTFRLLRQRSEKYIRTHLNGMITYAYDSGTNKQDYHYQYDLVGNILKITDKSPEAGVGGSASLERTFDYDPLYRLLKATGRENAPLEPMPWDDAYRSQDKTLTTAYTQNYTYDKMGNILKLQHLGNSNFTRNFSYNANSNKLDELQFGSTTLNYNYDPCGNLLNEDASRHNEWDYADRMRCFRIQTPNNEPSKYAQYLYDAEGNRVMKLVRNQGGTWSSIIYIDGIFEFLQNNDEEEQSNSFIMDDRSRIAIIRAGDDMGDGSPVVKYNLEDSLGSSMTLLSTNGSWINWEEYYPFGETSFGSYSKKRYQYTGKERDEESGLYYYGARYYAAWTCRFVSVDSLAFKYPFYSPYQYSGNKPISFIDIDGLEEEKPNLTWKEKKEIRKSKYGKFDNIFVSDPILTEIESDKQVFLIRKNESNEWVRERVKEGDPTKSIVEIIISHNSASFKRYEKQKSSIASYRIDFNSQSNSYSNEELSQDNLSKIADALKSNPEQLVQIQGNTNAGPTDNLQPGIIDGVNIDSPTAQQVVDARASKIQDDLVGMGVPSEQIQVLPGNFMVSGDSPKSTTITIHSFSEFNLPVPRDQIQNVESK